MRGIKVSSFLRAGSWTLDVIEQMFSRPTLRSYLAEFISTFVFVFAGVGSATSAGKLMASDATLAGASLVAIALAHGFALAAAVYVAGDVSGGHINPAVTFGFVLGGHIGLLTGICYCGAQLFGSTMACVLLMLVTAGEVIPLHGLDPEMTGLRGMVTECIATFALVYCVYGVWDPRNGSHRSMGPIVIGFIYGANSIVLDPFMGGSMNPARSFGPAIVTGNFRDHWVYWVGPLMGGGLAGLVYKNFMSLAHDQSPADDVVV
ncbi:aquaporin TIP2-1-like [Malania oleifera]|uniref:aquaporin TIP2-1-like n=1 Tax=Malania oleifera TaxID=397392 RepID=UPI0025AE312B|nr:aquaporin TIP2-1-like [Malania oleifera]